jgi:hypothetical protein
VGVGRLCAAPHGLVWVPGTVGIIRPRSLTDSQALLLAAVALPGRGAQAASNWKVSRGCLGIPRRPPWSLTDPHSLVRRRPQSLIDAHVSFTDPQSLVESDTDFSQRRSRLSHRPPVSRTLSCSLIGFIGSRRVRRRPPVSHRHPRRRLTHRPVSLIDPRSLL